MKRLFALVALLAAGPLFGALATAEFAGTVGRLEAQFPRERKVFVGGDMKSSPDFPLRITEVRGTQSMMARGGVYLIEGNVHAPISAGLIEEHASTDQGLVRLVAVKVRDG